VKKKLSPKEYFKFIVDRRLGKKSATDYLLCSYLIDKDLNGFAKELKKHYAINDSLPKHYREALVLYTHSRSNPLVEYHDNVMETDFQDFQKVAKSRKNKADLSAKNNNWYSFKNTYWYYYRFR